MSFPQEMEKEIKSVFRGGNQDEVLSEAFRLTITRKDIQTLNNLNWLNDEVSSCRGAAGLKRTKANRRSGCGPRVDLPRTPRVNREFEKIIPLGRAVGTAGARERLI